MITMVLEELATTDFGNPILILIAGLLIAFAGRFIWKAVWFTIGALIGIGVAMFVYAIIQIFMDLPGVCFLVAILVGAIVGGLAALNAIKFWISATAGFAGLVTAFMLTNNIIVALVVGIIFFAIMYFYFDEFLSVMSGLIGGLLTGYAVGVYTHSAILFFVVAIPVAIAGAYVQLQIEEKQKRDGDERIEDAA
jgi:hypothetical protein